MRLKVGDKIYCIVDKCLTGLTKNKCYEIIKVKISLPGDGICIKDDNGFDWWFGQIGEFEPWTKWFISEKEWLRNEKLKELGI